MTFKNHRNAKRASDVIIPNAPFAVAFEVISRCNLDCKYCYAKPFSGACPSHEEIFQLFSKTKKEVDPFKVTIEGGEPFLREDICDLLITAKNFFGNVAVVTNGTLLDKLSESDWQKLKSFTDGYPNIQVSLDASELLVNDSVRGLGSKTLSGLRSLDEHDVSFAIGIVMTKINLASVVNTVRFVVENYKNLQSVHLMNVMPSMDIGEEWFNLKYEPEAYFPVSQGLKEISDALWRRNITIAEPTTKSCIDDNTVLDEQNLKSCTAGLLRVVVLANGDVIPCEMTRKTIVGNLFKDSWKKIWDNSLNEYFSNNISGGKCFYKNLQSGDIRKLPHANPA